MKIKICGLSRPEEIWMVNKTIPDYVGFVFVKQSRRYVSQNQAEMLREKLRPEISVVGVFVDAEIAEIQRFAAAGVIDIVQLHGSENPAYVQALKCLVHAPVIKAISMTEEHYKAELKQWENSDVDFLLLDSGAGGTGQQFDYTRIEEIGKPFFLAGGLTPDNVAEAIQKVNPYGVDMSSGVETEGKKDAQKIEEAARRIRNVKG